MIAPAQEALREPNYAPNAWSSHYHLVSTRWGCASAHKQPFPTVSSHDANYRTFDLSALAKLTPQGPWSRIASAQEALREFAFSGFFPQSTVHGEPPIRQCSDSPAADPSSISAVLCRRIVQFRQNFSCKRKGSLFLFLWRLRVKSRSSTGPFAESSIDKVRIANNHAQRVLDQTLCRPAGGD